MSRILQIMGTIAAILFFLLFLLEPVLGWNTDFVVYIAPFAVVGLVVYLRRLFLKWVFVESDDG